MKLQIEQIIRGVGGELSPALPIYRQLTSVQLVELLVGIEKAFHIEISVMDYDPRRFETVETILSLIQSNLKNSKL